MRLRTIGEHLAIPNKTELDASRHTEGSLIERLSIAPLNINYHVEHHLFPSVPFYNLPKLYEVLKHNKNFQEHILFNKTYLGFKENELLGQIILH